MFENYQQAKLIEICAYSAIEFFTTKNLLVDKINIDESFEAWRKSVDLTTTDFENYNQLIEAIKFNIHEMID